MDTMYLKDSVVIFGSEGSALILHHLELYCIMCCHCSSIMKKNQFLVIFYGTKWPLYADVSFIPHS